MSEEEIERLTTKHNWELVREGCLWYLRQKDKHYMQTMRFEREVAKEGK